MKGFGAYLKEQRSRRGLSIRKAAALVGVSPSRLGEIERGESYRTLRETRPSRELIESLARAYEIDVNGLLEMAGYQSAAAAPAFSPKARLAIELFESLDPDRQELALEMLKLFSRQG